MPAPLTSTNLLKQRLLTGASAAVIVMALSVTAPSGVRAQTVATSPGPTIFTTGSEDAQIDDGFQEAATGDAIVVIDINNADDDTATFLNDSSGGANQALTINVIDGSADNTANTLTLTGDAAASNGGTIAINVGNGTTQPVNLEIYGNVTEATGGAVTIVLGNGVSSTAVSLLLDASGVNQTVDAAINVADDSNDIALTVANSIVGIGATTFTDTITLGDGDTLTIGGAVANAETSAMFEAAVDVSTTGIITVGGAATAAAVFAADVTAQTINVDSISAAAGIQLGRTGGESTVTADIDSLSGSNFANLRITDGADVTLDGDIQNTAGVGGWDEITVGGGSATTFTMQGNINANAPVTLSDNATLVFDTDGGLVAANLSVGLDSTINAAGAGLTTTLQTIGTNSVNFQDEVGTGGAISLIDLDATTVFSAVSGGDFDIDGTTTALGQLTATGDVDVADPFTLMLNGTTNAIAGDITGEGTLELGSTDTLTLGATGETSTISIANLGGNGNIAFATGSMVTIETAIGAASAIGNFTMNEADTTVTINSGTTATGETAINGNAELSLGAGTIVLGSNIGQGDTVFSFTGYADLVTEDGETTTVQLSANFLEGDITFAAMNVSASGHQGGAIDENLANGELEVTQTALTEFVLSTDGLENQNILITANARSAEDTADKLGISTEDAEALRQALISADATGDDESYDFLNTALNAGLNSASAALAAQQVGTQEDTLGGASQTAFAMFGEQTGFLTNRLERSRSQSGFSGGDLPGQYSPQAEYAAPAPTSSMGGVWGQAFGGVANADGDTNFAGWDASYGGLMVGLDGMVSDTVTIGAFGSYSFSSVDGDGAGNSQIDANTFGFGVYAGYAGDGFYLDGFAAYAMSQNDLSRTDAMARRLSADYDASQFSIGAAGGAPIEMSSNVFITPNASLTYNHYDADTYTETGSPMAQTVNSDAVSNLTGTIGARIHAVYENFDNDGTVFIPELRVALIGDLIDDDATAMATFTGATAYQVTGTDTDNVGALIGIGLGLDNPDWSAGISYDADIRSEFMSHTARAEFRWKF